MGDRIKSAAELAMEKTRNINKESSGGTAFTDKDQYIKAARVLAENLVEGNTETAKIKESLNRYPREVIPEVTEVMLKTFINKINLDNTARVFKAISYFRDDEPTRNSLEEAKKVYRHYYKLREEKWEELQKNAQKQLLSRLSSEGISGSAIHQVKAKNHQAEKQITDQLNQEYLQNLSGFLSFLEQSLNSQSS